MTKKHYIISIIIILILSCSVSKKTDDETEEIIFDKTWNIDSCC